MNNTDINGSKLLQYKEYYNNEKNNYYFKIGITKNNNILIRLYKLDLLNNICYQTILELTKIKENNKIFTIFENINGIYNLLIKGLNNNKYKIECNKDNVLFIIFIEDLNEIQIVLEKTQNYNIFEYNLVLSNTINKLNYDIEKFRNFYNYNKYDLNNNTNISTNTNILNEINYLKEEIKKINKNLNDIIEENNTNKKIISNLQHIISNIPINKQENILLENIIQKNNQEKDIENNNKIKQLKVYKPKKEKNNNKKEEEIITLQEFNKIFKTYIRKNDNITELKLGYKNLGVNKLKYLSLIDFSNLEQLWLSNNNITDINILEKTYFPKLQTLDLSDNKISNIDIFENVNFNNLRKLWLNNNIINDISAIFNCFPVIVFMKLVELNLKNNKIKDISIFEKSKFIYLQSLDLSLNKIEIEIAKNKDICDNLRTKIKYFNI